MSKKSVMHLVSELMGNAQIRSALAQDPMSVLIGYDLTETERNAFIRLDLSSFDWAASGLDERTNKSLNHTGGCGG